MNDHRRLGREPALFGSDPLIGAGLPDWLPGGAAIRQAIEEYLREAERRAATSNHTLLVGGPEITIRPVVLVA